MERARKRAERILSKPASQRAVHALADALLLRGRLEGHETGQIIGQALGRGRAADRARTPGAGTEPHPGKSLAVPPGPGDDSPTA